MWDGLRGMLCDDVGSVREVKPMILAHGLITPTYGHQANTAPAGGGRLTPPAAIAWLSFHGENLVMSVGGFGRLDVWRIFESILMGLAFWAAAGAVCSRSPGAARSEGIAALPWLIGSWCWGHRRRSVSLGAARPLPRDEPACVCTSPGPGSATRASWEASRLSRRPPCVILRQCIGKHAGFRPRAHCQLTRQVA
jgi:hypothetical protein